MKKQNELVEGQCKHCWSMDTKKSGCQIKAGKNGGPARYYQKYLCHDCGRMTISIQERPRNRE